MRPLRVLFVSPEVEPFVKAGGLGDMVGALPKDLAALGHDVRITCPLYGSVKRIGEWKVREDALGVDVGREARWARVWQTSLPGVAVPVYFLEHDWFFARPEVYSSWSDNSHRFAFMCRAALTLCEQMEWIPDVIHCHDWTTGLVPVLLNTVLRDRPMGRAATVFTIHNLEHQGYSDKGLVTYARLPWSEFRQDSIESYGQVNLMKAGLYHATKLTTVSPTYAAEIRTPGGGFGLDHVLRWRGADLIGIVNGIDAASWDPATDATLAAPYSAANLAGKAECKRALQQQMGLAVEPRVPVIGVVARFASQKGLDLFADALPSLMEGPRPVQAAVLGGGDPQLEATFRALARQYPGRVAVQIGFDAKLARRIQAGADLFAMPSRSEPCGLTQMYAMRYGTPPVVRATGGLLDTVDNYEAGRGRGTGFVFHDPTPAALFGTLDWAVAAYLDHAEDFQGLQQRAMAQDFAWRKSAEKYVEVYEWAMAARTGMVS
ncbi:MAG TPA: glycogen synthase GlgA [Candidatus Didemnitutus sp.]|jgi:starch synthase